MNPSPNQTAAVEIARQLATAGVPIFLAQPAYKLGQWDPTGGHGGCGYTLPSGWQQVPADPKVLDRWRPGVAVCAVMGQGLDLVDVDPRNGGDADAVKPYLPTVHAVAATPSGGWHAYVRTLGIRSHDNVLPGIDVKAGDSEGKGRGFAFIAPTVRKPKTGGEPVAYRWERPPDLDTLAADNGSGSGSLRDLVAAARNSHQPSTAGLTAAPTFEPSPWDDLPDVIPPGARHATVYRLACSLRARGGWRLDDALRHMQGVVWPRIQAGAGEDGGDYTLDELTTDVGDAFTRHPDGRSGPGLTGIDRGEPTDERQPAHDPLVTGGSFILDQATEIPAVWGRAGDVLAPSGEPTYIAGPEGVGKTTLAMQLVRARIGLADEVLGYPVRTDGKPVLYLAMDRPTQIARAFNRLFNADDRAVLDERLIVWKGPLPQIIEEDPEQILQLALKVDAGTVFIDSVKDLTPTIEKPESAGHVNRAFQMCVSQGVEILALHHPRKANAQNKKPNSLDDLYGGRWLAAGAGSVLSLWGKAGDPVVELSHLKIPVNEVGPLTVIHDQRAGTSTVEHGRNLTDIVTASSGSLTVKDAARLLYGTDSPRRADVEKVRRRLEELHEQGLVGVEEADNGATGGRPTKRYRAAVTTSQSNHASNHAGFERGGNHGSEEQHTIPAQTQSQSNHATHTPEQSRNSALLDKARVLRAEEPPPLPPCSICGEPTRDHIRRVHQRCLPTEGAA